MQKFAEITGRRKIRRNHGPATRLEEICETFAEITGRPLGWRKFAQNSQKSRAGHSAGAKFAEITGRPLGWRKFEFDA
jgi:hypothetical protein